MSAVSDPSNLATSTKPKLRYISQRRGHESKRLETDRHVALVAGIVHEPLEEGLADPAPADARADEHALDLCSRVVDGLECAHADRFVTAVGHQQPTASPEQPGKLGSERFVMAGQIGGGEDDPGVVRQLAGDPFAVFTKERIDGCWYVGGGDARDVERPMSRDRAVAAITTGGLSLLCVGER